MITATQFQNQNIFKKAYYAAQTGLIVLYDVTAAGLDTCGRKVENLTNKYLPPRVAKVANYIIGALPVAAFWTLTLALPFYLSIPLVTVFTLATFAKRNDLSAKADINLANGNGIGSTIMAIDMLRTIGTTTLHPAILIGIISFNILFAASSFVRAFNLIRTREQSI